MRGFASRGARLVALLVVVAPALASADELFMPPSPCAPEGEVVTVLVRQRELWLCDQGTPVARFQVALGRGGVDKRRQGDRRTPVGTYELGTPRPSPEFGTFIPIAYPTPAQAAEGFTGSQLGIHGPPRNMAEPEYPTTAVDWTQGCIALGADPDIETIAEFVRNRRPTIIIR